MGQADFEQMSNNELAVYVKNHCFDGWPVLIERNRPFYQKIAQDVVREIHAGAYLIPALLDEVTESMYEAVEHFDPAKGMTFLTFAGKILYNRMIKALGILYKPREISIELIEWEMREQTGEEDWKIQLPVGDLTEPAAVKKVYFEQFRDCFLQLEDEQRQVLECKFGYDPYEPVLSCPEDYKSDIRVTAILESKPSIVRSCRIAGYEELRKKPFFAGYKKKIIQEEVKKEPGIYFDDFWVV